MKKKEETPHSFHVKMTEKQRARFERAVKKCPNKMVKNKTDLFWYVFETFFDAVGVK